MSWLGKLKIGQRLMIGFAVVLAMMIAIGALSYSRVDLIGAGLTTINDVNSVKQRYAINFRGSVHDRAISLRDVSLVDNPRELKEAIDEIERLAAAYRDSAVKLDAIFAAGSGVTEDERRILASIKETEAKTLPLIAKVVQVQQAGDGGQAKAVLMSAARPLFVEWLARINQFIDLQEAKNQALGLSVRSVVDRFELLLVMILLVAGTIGAGVAYWSMQAIKPLRELTGVMTRFAEGDLTPVVRHAERQDEIGAMAGALGVLQANMQKVRVLEEQEREASARRLRVAESISAVVTDVGEVVSAAANGDFSARLRIDDADEQMRKLVEGINEINAVVDGATTEFAETLRAIAGGDLTRGIETNYRGRFRDLKDAINETVERLSATVRTIQVTSADVGLAAREINMGADDLSKRTEEQASSLEETAATTEELAASVKASAQGARQAASIADEAMQAARGGGAIATEAVAAMARIESASQKISDIIRVIDDIAFQTNLLALNAAVEAARAGDAGKGFAVVASEVRTLAQRSSSAAKDISGLISSSNAEVTGGVKLVRQAGEQLAQILAASEKVASTIADISAASAEQASGIDEMSQAVAHLDEMTQANAALAEESAASAASLTGKIGQLNELVAAFKTGQEGATSAARPAAAYAPPKLRASDHAATASGAAAEPARLQKLAEAAFAQSRAAPAPRAPAKKVANGRANDAGWEEF